jgi:hypothetical protein
LRDAATYSYRLLLIVLLIALPWSLRRAEVRKILLPAVAASIGVSVIFFGMPRFHAPLIPTFILLATIGLHECTTTIVRWQRTPLPS